jgi:uncharacterized protein YecT (DUF1311 family)
MGMLTAVLVILAACGNSSDESRDNQSQNNNSTLNTNDDSLIADSTENSSKTDNTNEDTIDTGSNDAKEKVDTPNNILKKEEDISTNKTASLKEGYLKKLIDAKNEVEEMRKNPIDDTTFALKKVEGDTNDVWDGLLNEQREWINYRDNTAIEASLKYKGGTMEQYEYVRVENNFTEKRCFKLVEEFMN